MTERRMHALPALTQRQLAQAEVTQADMIDLVKRLEADGFDAKAVLTGMTTAMMCVIETVYSREAVPTWFAHAAAQTMAPPASK